MSPQMGGFWLLVAIGCSMIPHGTYAQCKRMRLVMAVGQSLCDQKLPFLPEELASIVKQMSYDAGRAAAHHDSADHVDRSKALVRNRVETLKRKSVGLLSTENVDDLGKMVGTVASLVRTKRSNPSYLRSVFKMMIDGIDCALMKNMVPMAGNITLCLFNNITGSGHCNVNTHNIDFHYNKVLGTPRVKRVVFHKDQPLQIGSPIEDSDTERVTNRESEPITLTRTYTERRGSTTSVTPSMQFSARVSAGFSFGFSLFENTARTSFSFRASTSSTTTFIGEIMKETSVQRKFSFTVAAGESAIISVKQEQLNLRLRYTVELDFNGVVKNMTGIWEGTANSNIEVSFIPEK